MTKVKASDNTFEWKDDIAKTSEVQLYVKDSKGG
jgi:uncharacterized protein involved in tolerance to divalent cations